MAVVGGLLVVAVMAGISLRYTARKKKVMSFACHCLVPGSQTAAQWAGGNDPVTAGSGLRQVGGQQQGKVALPDPVPFLNHAAVQLIAFQKDFFILQRVRGVGSLCSLADVPFLLKEDGVT